MVQEFSNLTCYIKADVTILYWITLITYFLLKVRHLSFI